MSKAKKRKPLPPGLTERHQRFCLEILVQPTHAEAAIAAGYSPKTAGVQAARLLRKFHVQAEISRLKAERALRTGITQDRVLEETGLLAFSDLTHYVVDDEGNVALAPSAPPGAMRALQSIKRRFITTGTGRNLKTTCEVEIRLWDKPGPLKLAGRHVDVHGFADRVELTGKNGSPLEAVTKIEVVIVDPRGGA